MIDRDEALQSWDVVQDVFDPSSCEILEQCVRGPGRRILLRFNGASVNAGTEDLILGDPEKSPLFELSACHDHYHLRDYMLLELLNAQTLTPVRVDGVAAIGRKEAFCVEDDGLMQGTSSSKGYDCSNQGLTAGWEDVYDKSLPCQWVDVTGVPPGDYVLRLTVNPSHLIPESNYDNNTSDIPVTIPDPGTVPFVPTQPFDGAGS